MFCTRMTTLAGNGGHLFFFIKKTFSSYALFCVRSVSLLLYGIFL